MADKLIEDAMKVAEEIARSITENEKAKKAYKNMLLATYIVSKTVGEDILVDIQALIADRNRGVVAPRTPVPINKDQALASVYDYDILK